MSRRGVMRWCDHSFAGGEAAKQQAGQLEGEVRREMAALQEKDGKNRNGNVHESLDLSCSR